MKNLLFILFIFFAISTVDSQPNPGNVFREYVWIPSMVKSEGGKFLRVGGKLDYKINFGHFPEHRQKDGYIPLEQYVELENAVKAEMQIEKVGSHEDTKNLRVSMNNYPSIIFPASEGIPKQEADYMHHNYPIAQIPIVQLREGLENSFRFDVDTAQRWNWPQNIIYGVVLRVYYKPETAYFKSEIAGLKDGDVVMENERIGLQDPNQNIRKVEYVGYYEDLNFEGDGVYTQWHYHYFRGQIMGNIGTANKYPYQTTWNTSWVPEQEKMKVAARVVANSGLIYFTEAIENLKFERNYKVQLCKPYDQPKNWVTRQDEFTEKIDLKTDPNKIDQASLYWVSWSPCYANGVYVNDVKVFDREGPCYEYMKHEVVIDDPSILKLGRNIIKTGKEPLHDGQMVHGMEVQWPGIMMKVRTKEK